MPSGQKPAGPAGFSYQYRTETGSDGITRTILGDATNLQPLYQLVQPGYSGFQGSDELRKALEAYRDAGDDSDAKSSARNEASTALSKLYDEYLDSQDEGIVALEKRIADLREQLARRRQAKSRMVELKLEMLLSEVEGLGWPEREPNATPGFSIGATIPVKPLTPNVLLQNPVR